MESRTFSCLVSVLTLSLSSGNALTDFFLTDVGITQNQFNVGQQLLSAGIVLLEARGAARLATNTSTLTAI